MFGDIEPIGKTFDSYNSDKMTERFKACLFLQGVDEQRFGTAVEELNNQCLTGTNGCPVSPEGAVNVLTHRIENIISIRLPSLDLLC